MSFSIQHIRNATSLVTMNDKRILVDPMLSDVGQLPPVPFTRTLRRNPSVPLPVTLDTFDNIDAILLTHLKQQRPFLTRRSPSFANLLIKHILNPVVSITFIQ